ncbi:TetR/AcrR family transcriptional regulator [Nocardioides litoris]|uniref:TetR/AcrR family transcriptional regulator n=1 Tax=Nocardioides litoris TaxID=1926648 RepID=UPI0011245ADD|nr:TetR/AcrR family transcriptional regulator [Nocardioides litoris]
MDEPEQATDGRVLRGQRTRAACIEAFLRLVADRELRVTGARVAEAAGVSVRSLWAHFPDLEALHDAAARELWHGYLTGHQPLTGDGPLDQRLGRWCAQRAEELEDLAPYAVAAALREPFSPALRESRARFVGSIVVEAQVVFAAELEGAATGRLQAVVAASAYPCWTTWRDDLGLDVAGARDAMTATLRGLLTP